MRKKVLQLQSTNSVEDRQGHDDVEANDDDGIFWLTIEDFCSNFRSFYWCSESTFLGHNKYGSPLNVGMRVIALQDFKRSSSGQTVLKGTKGVITKIDGDGDCICKFDDDYRKVWAFPRRGDIFPDLSITENVVKQYQKSTRMSTVQKIGGNSVWKEWSWEQRLAALKKSN